MLGQQKQRNCIPLQAMLHDSIHHKFAGSDKHQQPYLSDTATEHPLENKKLEYIIRNKSVTIQL